MTKTGTRFVIAVTVAGLLTCPWSGAAAQMGFPMGPGQMPGGGGPGQMPGPMGPGQMPGPMGPGQMPGFPMGPGQMPGGMPGMTTGSCPTIDHLKSALAITDAQKNAWEAYAAALKNNLKGLHAARESMTAMSGKPSVEQLDAQVTAAESRLKAIKELKPTLTALYAALNADQKKKADQMLIGMSCMI